MATVLTRLHKSIVTYGAPALVAVTLHGAMAAGVWSLGRSETRAPKILSSFEVVELPSSAAVVEPLAPTPEPEPEVKPEPLPEPPPEPETVAAPEPTPEPAPVPPPKPKPKPVVQPKPQPKPVVQPKPVLQPKQALVQQAEALASAPAYVAPSQHAAYLDNPKPAYPTMARKRGMEGRVVLRVQVRPDGTVKAVEVEQSAGFALLDRAARTAVLRWRFAPATRGKIAVEGEVLVPFDFRLTAG